MLDRLRRTLPRPPRGRRAAEPRRADLLRPGQAGLPDGADQPPRRRSLRDLVRGARRDAGNARRRRPRAVLRAALRRPSGLARPASRPRARLGRAGRHRRGRVRRGRAGHASSRRRACRAIRPRYTDGQETYGGAMASTWSILRQSCKPRSPVGLVKQPETQTQVRKTTSHSLPNRPS